MKTFQQNNITYLAVEVPEGASDFGILVTTGEIEVRPLLEYDLSDTEADIISLPNGIYSIIGLLPEITEEQAEEMVSKFHVFDDIDGYSDGYIDGAKLIWNLASQALKSRIRQLGFTNENILIIKQIT